MLAIAKALETNKTLAVFDIYADNITSKGAIAIAKALETNPQRLTSVSLKSKNKISEVTLERINVCLKPKPKPITVLTPTERMIKILNTASPQEIEQEIPKLLETITELRLDERIGREGVKALADILKGNKTLKTLVFSSKYFGNEEICIILEALVKNPNLGLTELDFGGFPIKPEVVKSLASLLKVNTSLKTLNLSNQAIEDEGLIIISEAIRTNPNLKLERFYMTGCNVGPKGAKALAELFKDNTTLETFNIQSNHIGDEGAALIINALENNPNSSITILNLSENNITNVGAIRIAKFLEQNSTLEELYIYRGYGHITGTVGAAYNTINNIGAIAIFEALEKNPNSRLTELSLEKTPGINQTTLDRIKACLERNKLSKIAKQKPQQPKAVTNPVVLPQLPTALISERGVSFKAPEILPVARPIVEEEESTPAIMPPPSTQRPSVNARDVQEAKSKAEAAQRQAEEATKLAQEANLKSSAALELSQTTASQQKQNSQTTIKIARLQSFADRKLNTLEELNKAIQETVNQVPIADLAEEKVPEFQQETTANIKQYDGFMKAHASELERISNTSQANRANLSKLESVLAKDQDTRDYYSTIIGSTNSLFSAAQITNSKYFKPDKAGNFGNFGMFLEVIGAASPVAGGLISLTGSFATEIGRSLNEKDILKISKLCNSPVEMDMIAKDVASFLVQLPGKHDTKEAQQHMKNMLKAIFKENSKIKPGKELATSLASAALRRELTTAETLSISLVSRRRAMSEDIGLGNNLDNIVAGKEVPDTFATMMQGIFVAEGISSKQDQESMMRELLGPIIRKRKNLQENSKGYVNTMDLLVKQVGEKLKSSEVVNGQVVVSSTKKPQSSVQTKAAMSLPNVQDFNPQVNTEAEKKSRSNEAINQLNNHIFDIAFSGTGLSTKIQNELKTSLKIAIGNEAANNPDFGNYFNNMNTEKDLRATGGLLKNILKNEAIRPGGCFTPKSVAKDADFAKVAGQFAREMVASRDRGLQVSNTGGRG